MIYDLIIIGSGSAGLTAAIYAARKKINALVLTKKIGDRPSAGYEIENFPGFLKIRGAELNEKMKEQAERYGVPIKEEMAVSDIEKKDGNFLIKTEQKENFEAKAVIVASGRKPKKLNVPGAKEFETKGVSFCTTCDAPVFAERDVAVIGGGNAALISALDLTSYTNKVYLLQHDEKFIGDETTMEKLRVSGKVIFLVNAETIEIQGNQFVESLVYEDAKTKEKKELKVSGIFISIGQSPNTEFAKNLVNLNERGEIIIDPFTTQSSVPGLYAAGDCANTPYKQCVIAAGEGAKAALSTHEYLENKK